MASAKFSKYLVATSTSGGKFWEVEVVGPDVRVRYGKLGADAKWSTTSLGSAAEAVKHAEKLAHEKLRKGYAEAPRTASVSTDAVDLAKVAVTGVFYFRAFDRYPGGNADMFTIKVTLAAEPGKKPAFTARSHNNWDGEHWVYPEVEIAPPGAAAAVKTMLAAAQALIDAGLTDSKFTIVEGRDDNEEYDTEWSSLEFSLHVHDKGAPTGGKLALHVVQAALSGARKQGSPPDERSQAFIDAVHRMLGVGRVEAYSDGKDAFSQAYKKKAKGQSLGYKRAAVPLYL